jgi:hypothetical protein
MQGLNVGDRKRAGIPTIACINKATVDLGVDFGSLISALQTYVDEHLAPVWGTPAKLVRTTKPRDGMWSMIFVDTANAMRKLRADLEKIFGKNVVNEIEGYHLVNGRPVALVFAKNALADRSLSRIRDKISMAASHELAEMLVDPGANLWCEYGKDTLYAYEVCDAVEAKYFRVNGMAMSDFVYPAYFEGFHKRNSVQFDHLKKVKYPFHILKDGYAPIRKGGKLILRSTSKKRAALRNENRDLHRSEFRKR